MCADLRDAAPREFKIYDKSRTGDWMSSVGPTQCVAFFKDFHTAAPMSYRCESFLKMSDCTFLLFDRLDEARSFCEAAVNEHPSICAEIFDHQGRAKEPLLVVVDARVAEKGELSATSVRKRRLWAFALFCGGGFTCRLGLVEGMGFELAGGPGIQHDFCRAAVSVLEYCAGRTDS
jgi:hypothetical protein